MNSQQRILIIVEMLVGNRFFGMANKSLASKLGTSEANICRDLKVLESRQWVDKASDGRWRLTPKFGGFAGQIMKNFQAAKLRLAEDEARYASEMQQEDNMAKKAVTESSTEIMVRYKEEQQEADRLYLDGKPYDLDRIDNEVFFYQDKAGESLLEIGKRFILVKLHEDHGKFMAFLEKHDMGIRSADYAMAAAGKFSNTKSVSHLGTAKMIALSVLDGDDVQKLADGGAVAGMTIDDIDRMSTRELRGNLRKEKEQAKKEKEARKKDRTAFEQSMLQKDAKINELDLKLSGQEPPTKEQIAQTALIKMIPEYSIAVAKVNGAACEAYALVVKAEKIEGVNVQQLSEWLGQFSPDMQTFHDLVQTWTDEIDNAGPVADWRKSDLPGGEVPA